MDYKNSKRPLVTFALLAYNQEQYVREAVEAVLSQTYEPIEVILSDDCSTDATYEILSDASSKCRRASKIKVLRNDKNLGLAAHFNKIMAKANGSIIILAAGDDISLPDRAEISVQALNRYPSAFSILLSANLIDSNGGSRGERVFGGRDGRDVLQNINDLIRGRLETFGATRAFRRELFDIFGPLNDDCPTEDTPLLIRSIIAGCSVLLHEKGVQYRIHDGSLSAPKSLAKMDLDKIYSQYSADIEVGKKKGLITKREEKILSSWMVDDRFKREVRLKVVDDRPIRCREAFKVLKLRGLSMREKLFIISRVRLRAP